MSFLAWKTVVLMEDAWLSALGWFGRNSAPFFMWLICFLQEGPWDPAQRSSCSARSGAHWLKSCLKLSVSLGQPAGMCSSCSRVHIFIQTLLSPLPLVTLLNSVVSQCPHFCTDGNRQPLIHALLGLFCAYKDEQTSQDFILWFFSPFVSYLLHRNAPGSFPGTSSGHIPCVLQLATVPGSAQGIKDHLLQQHGKMLVI